MEDSWNGCTCLEYGARTVTAPMITMTPCSLTPCEKQLVDSSYSKISLSYGNLFTVLCSLRRSLDDLHSCLSTFFSLCSHRLVLVTSDLAYDSYSLFNMVTPQSVLSTYARSNLPQRDRPTPITLNLSKFISRYEVPH